MAGRHVTQRNRAAPSVVAKAACPHCNVTLPAGWSSSRAGRCPTCCLLIAAHRAAPATRPDGHTASAAGMIASAARRSAVSPQQPHVILEALRVVAAAAGCGVARLRMLDYQTISAADRSLPALDAVLATFGTWKEARRRAAEPRWAFGDQRSLGTDEADGQPGASRR